MGAQCSRPPSSSNVHLLTRLGEILFSLNLSCALVYAACLYIAQNLSVETPPNDVAYYFLRGVVRMSDVLHRVISTPVVASAVARHDSVLWRPGLIALTILATLWSSAALIQLAVRAFVPRFFPNTFQIVSLSAALFSAPIACGVAIWHVTSNAEHYDAEHYDPVASTPFGLHVLMWLLTAEVVAFVVLSLLGRKRNISRWIGGTLIVLHVAFWAVILFPSFIIYIGESKSRLLVHVASYLLPTAGSAFLTLVWPRGRMEPAATLGVDKWTILAALLGAAGLLLIWLPTPPRHSVNPAVIELARGPCFGGCPVYTLTIHSDGNVEYKGQTTRGSWERQAGKITPSEFAQLVSILNRVGMSNLEDRAFRWCFDTPSVSVTVVAEGYTKQVSSDSYCTGAKNSPQASFVEATAEIDKIIGSDRWLACQGHPCR